MSGMSTVGVSQKRSDSNIKEKENLLRLDLDLVGHPAEERVVAHSQVRLSSADLVGQERVEK
jgi:hypothetical protein